VFAVNFPLALLAMGLVLLWAPKDAPTAGGIARLWTTFDLIGLGLFAVFLLSVMVFLMNLSHPLWPALPVAALFGVALVLWSRRHPDPFIDVRMLASNRPLSFTYIRIAAILTIGYCMFYGLAQWLQSAAGLGSSEAGLITIPMSVVAAAASFLGARTRSIRTPFLIASGAALVGSLALLLLINHDSPVWLISAAVALFGLPIGMTSTATQAAVYIQAPPDKIGTASGLQRTAAYLGSIFSASLLALTFGEHATDAGFHVLMAVLAGLSAILVLAVLIDPTLPKAKAAQQGGSDAVA
jgi:predicted MFS family arabinose efflux permease